MKAPLAEVFTPNKTSARLLVDYARVSLLGDDGGKENLQKFLILYDLYIKARSYSIFNKIALGVAVPIGIMVLVWPALAVISQDLKWDREFLKSAVVQTAITGLAALAFAMYSHYKKRQLFTENLMRYVLFSDESTGQVQERVIREMERIDTGFSFTQSVLKKAESDDIKGKASS